MRTIMIMPTLGIITKMKKRLLAAAWKKNAGKWI